MDSWTVRRFKVSSQETFIPMKLERLSHQCAGVLQWGSCHSPTRRWYAHWCHFSFCHGRKWRAMLLGLWRMNQGWHTHTGPAPALLFCLSPAHQRMINVNMQMHIQDNHPCLPDWWEPLPPGPLCVSVTDQHDEQASWRFHLIRGQSFAQFLMDSTNCSPSLWCKIMIILLFIPGRSCQNWQHDQHPWQVWGTSPVTSSEGDHLKWCLILN